MPEQHPFERGPYLAVAVLCEKVLTEQDGVASLIRIVDRVTHQAIGPNAPFSLAPFQYSLWMFLSFKSGNARGTKDLTIRLQKPSGESPFAQTLPINFEGEDDRGANVVVQLQIEIDMVGLWWFDISLDGIPVTRLPLRIIYLRQTTQTQGPSFGGQPG